jgi:phosphatidylinositol-bisphosphatase
MSLGASAQIDDGRTFTPIIAKSIRQEWIEQQMGARMDEYSELKQVSLFCGTYNVNAKKEDGGLDEWIGPAQGENWSDLYVLGFQEIVDLNAMNVALDGSKTANRSQFWVDKIAESLRKNRNGDQYILVTQRSLVGLLMCVFAKESLTNSISDVRTASTAVGVMGVMGNKGGVSCRFSLFDSSVCFVCSHLAAHRGNVAGRNADYVNIVEKTTFAAAVAATQQQQDGIVSSIENHEELAAIDDRTTFVARPLRDQEKARRRALQIMDHDIVFWLGDLNYRIEETVPTQRVFDLIRGGEAGLKELAAQDQLNKVRESGTAFRDFEEGDVSAFDPTYKYAPGTKDYDERNPQKIRAPAWCDRVLWRLNNRSRSSSSSVAPGRGKVTRVSAHLLQYEACDRLLSSDHRPVRARFQLQCLQYLTVKEQVTFVTLQRQVERFANDLRALAETVGSLLPPPPTPQQLRQQQQQHNPNNTDPVVVPVNVQVKSSDLPTTLPVPELTLSDMILEFNHARYQGFCSQQLTVTNTGSTLAAWRVIPKLESSAGRLSKRWLHLTQTRGLLFPGESTKIGVHCFIDTLTAHRLNSGKEGLDDLLVLRVEGGIDHYIAVAGHYLRSSYGMSVQELVLTAVPARETLLPPARAADGKEVVMSTPASTTGGEVDSLAAFLSPGDTPGGATSASSGGVLDTPTTDNNGGNNPNQTRMSIPKELWRLVDHLWSAGAGGALRERDLFTSATDSNTPPQQLVLEVSSVREALDTGVDLPSCSPHSIVSALASFLVALPRPLIPPELCPQAHVEPADLRAWSRAFLQALPALSYNTFVYLLSFLREVLTQARFNRTSPTLLAAFCVDTMTALSPAYRQRQQMNCYHALAAAHTAQEQQQHGSNGKGGIGDSYTHSNLQISGNIGTGGPVSALETRRRAIGAVFEYLLTVESQL